MTNTLEERLRESPDDADAWVILGDQLQEAGDPLGELIALEAQQAGDSERREELRREVLAPLPTFVADEALTIEWRRGVPYRAIVAGSLLPLRALAQLPAARFLRELELSDIEDDVTELLDEAAFVGLSRLTFDAFDDVDHEPKKLGSSGASALVSCRRVAQLESLSLGGQQIGDEGAVAIARANLRRLRALSLINNGIGERGVGTLANSEHLAGLRELNLHYNFFGDEGLAHLTESRYVTQLTSLTLGANRISRGMVAHARSANLACVEALVLGFDDVGNANLEALAGSPHARRLTSLTLHACKVDDAGVGYLAASPLLAQLRELGLQGNTITDQGVIALTTAVTRLERLTLEFNAIGDDGYVALAECPHLASLTDLWLWGHSEHKRGIDALLASKYLSAAVKKSLAWQFRLGPDPRA